MKVRAKFLDSRYNLAEISVLFVTSAIIGILGIVVAHKWNFLLVYYAVNEFIGTSFILFIDRRD